MIVFLSDFVENVSETPKLSNNCLSMIYTLNLLGEKLKNRKIIPKNNISRK